MAWPPCAARFTCSLLLGVVLGGCAAAAPPASPTVTVTGVPIAVTSTATQTVTATVVRTVKAKPVTVTVAPAGPVDVTDEFRAKSKAGGMDPEQTGQVVVARLLSDSVEVLTEMRAPWGSWNCDGTPTKVGGVRLRFVTILYEDRTVFRNCSLS